MMYRLSRLALVCLCGVWLGVVSSAHADSPTLFPRPRMQSMGGSGIAARGSNDSALLNPAGLADVEKGRVNIFDLTVSAPFDLGLVNSFQDYNDVRDGSSSSTSDKKDAFYKFLQDASNDALSTRITLYPSYTRKNFHFGLIADMLVDPRFRLGGMTSNQVVELGGSSGTVGLVLGVAHSYLNDSLSVGVTIKPLYRLAITAQQTQTMHDILVGLNPNGASVVDQLFGSDKLNQQAFGVGVDVGVRYNLLFLPRIKPSFGITLQDAGDTRFFTDDPLPSNIPQNLAAGVAIHPDISFMRNTISFDLRNIQREAELMTKVQLGAESILFNLVALRAGLSQGYLTGGVGFISQLLQADVFIGAYDAGRYARLDAVRTIGTRVSLGF